MRLNSHSLEFDPLPLITKMLIGINVALFIMEVTLYLSSDIDLVANYCLSPAKIINEFQTSSYTINGISSLFLSNLFHLNPATSGFMGVMHIMMNMMVLHSTGKVLEQQFGSFIFLCITILFLLIIGPLQIPLAIMFETITMNKIGLLSTNQCGVGYSGVLFAYFMIYLSLIPNQRINFCGYQVKKWVVPFIELIMLSVMLQASFIGHLSGIIVGLLYITGLPGCFQLRQTCMRNIEYIFCIIQCIINRQDYVKMPQHPKIDKFFCRSKYSQRNNGISQRIPDDVSDTSDETGMDNDETDVLMI